MENQLSCIYKKGVSQKEVTAVEMSEIIDQIKYGQFKKEVQKIQFESSHQNDEQVKFLKLQLPVFYPTLESLEAFVVTGVIQFDIDTKNNPNLDIDLLAIAIIQISNTYYVFKSPNNGLKFGILTDFSNVSGENNKHLNTRFKFSYDFVLEYLLDIHSIPKFNADSAVKSIRQPCYLSYDKDAYYNEFATPLLVNEDSLKCIQTELAIKIPNSYMDNINYLQNESYVIKLLHFIPKDLGYVDRMPINYAVCALIGEIAGLNLLMRHWEIHSDKLAQQIKSQLSYRRYENNIGVLINLAKDYGYKSTEGNARNNLQPQLSKTQLPALLSADEATVKLKSAIDIFFKNKQNTYINVTAGAGKTKAVINILADADMSFKKVLFLVKEHSFGEQVKCDLNIEILKRRAKFTTFSREKFQYKNAVIIIKGKTQSKSENPDIKMCSNEKLIKQIHISTKDCLEKCYLQGECDYTAQFSSKANIRIMTHNEWFNNQSKWAQGLEFITKSIYDTPYGEMEQYSVIPSENKNYWIPNYIVIDEDILTIDNEITRSFEDESSDFNSIKSILQDLKLNKALIEVLENHKASIYKDSHNNKKITNSGKEIKKNFSYSDILACFNNYNNSGQSYHLEGINYKNNKLTINRLKQVQDRYRNVPTLILDATANEKIISHVYPSFKFVKLTVKSNSEINIYQLSNANFTKSYLEKSENLEIVTTGLKLIVGGYNKVGLISYKSINGYTDFTESLANKLGITICAHFGKLRGLNTFEDVDCLLVVGRYSLSKNGNQTFTEAVFGEVDLNDTKRNKLPKLVRMQSGEAYTLDNSVYDNRMLQDVYEQKSIAETIQALGRARPIHGKPKDVFLFSNESLGTDVEITDFFRYEDYFKKSWIDNSTLEKLLNVGFINTKNKEIVMALNASNFITDGMLDVFVKNHKPEIINELKDAGFSFHHQHEKYLVFDILKFEESLMKK